MPANACAPIIEAEEVESAAEHERRWWLDFRVESGTVWKHRDWLAVTDCYKATWRGCHRCAFWQDKLGMSDATCYGHRRRNLDERELALLRVERLIELEE